MNLKLLSSALPLFLLPLFAAGAARAEVLSVKSATANFREAPNEKATVKYTADKFYPVEVLEKQAGWMKVKDFEGDVAWVSSRALDTQPSIVVQVDRANMRTSPSTSAPVVFKVERGEVFKIEKREGPWLKVVDARGDGGWIRDDMTWGEPTAEKAEEAAKPDTAIAGEAKPEAAKEAPATKAEKAEAIEEAKAEPKAAPESKPIEPMLSTEPNLEALCRAYVARAEEKKTEQPAAAKPATEKKADKKAPEKKADKKADKAKPAKPAGDKKAGGKPKK